MTERNDGTGTEEDPPLAEDYVGQPVSDRGNTIAGWVLFAAGCALGLSLVTGEYFHSERPEKMGYQVEGVEAEAGADSGAAAEQPAAFYLAKADPAKGADVFKKCTACHSDQKGGPNQIGPQLWGVVGRPVASEPGFSYSDALKGKSGPWTFDELFAWLKSPKAYAPGTKMTFAGLSKPEDRADVIAYLNKQGDSPQPLPAAPAAAPAAAAGTEAGAKPGANTAGEGAKTQPVVTEGQAAAGGHPEGSVGGEGAPSVTGNAAQTKK
ncbi:c-type cytochrome [Sphingomonas morindae]|uniref:Cytochrome c family protein n=1 Tax=Sphingomonas morindae TaxID=1541170 RepID=A0ABY4X573_9SPHN|nr:cytochrome c family protein [Sphingomonas morindae]USI72039.1 cytochrome c family protein [Sphingomonas morindae]